MNYFVKGTYREDNCDDNSAIAGLVLTEKYKNGSVHDLRSLKELADEGRLWVDPNAPCGKVKVIIFWSTYYGKYIATTRADGVQCNNLLSLPIYYPSSQSEGTTTYYSVCAL